MVNNLFKHILLYSTFHSIYKNSDIYKRKKKYYINKNLSLDTCYLKKINIYSLSSFNIGLAGFFFMKYHIKENYYQSFFPKLLIIQSILSFFSDVLYVGENNNYNHLDFTFACYNTIITIILATKYNLNFLEKIIFICGLFIKKLDSYYFKNTIVDKYYYTHTLWHTILPFLSMYVVYKDNIEKKAIIKNI